MAECAGSRRRVTDRFTAAAAGPTIALPAAIIMSMSAAESPSTAVQGKSRALTMETVQSKTIRIACRAPLRLPRRAPPEVTCAPTSTSRISPEGAGRSSIHHPAARRRPHSTGRLEVRWRRPRPRTPGPDWQDGPADRPVLHSRPSSWWRRGLRVHSSPRPACPSPCEQFGASLPRWPSPAKSAPRRPWPLRAQVPFGHTSTVG